MTPGDQEREFLPLIRQRYAGDHNIETVFCVLDRYQSENAQLRNVLEAVKEENQRLRAHIDTITSEERTQISDDERPLTAEERSMIDAAWAKHKTTIGRDGIAEWRKRKEQK